MKAMVTMAAILMAATLTHGQDSDAKRMQSEEMNPGSALGSRERTGDGTFKILIYGNSIALHGPAPKIGWERNWGMAASAREKDFAHLVVADLEKRRGERADYRIRNLAALERNFTANLSDYPDLAADVAWAPDYVVIAIGENVANLTPETTDAYTRFLVSLAKPLVECAAHPQVIMRSPFWRNDVKAACTAKAAEEVGATYVDAGFLGADKANTAAGLFEHQGVANHPGDLGMRRLADLILAAIKTPAPRNTKPSISFTSDKDPLSYGLGEKMRFTITAAGGSRIRWTRTGDDGREEHGETSLVTRHPSPVTGGFDGSEAAVETALDRPGFVRIRAELLDDSGKVIASYDGGAGAAVDDIRPDNPEPPEFDAFWTRRKAALDAVSPAGATCREIASGREGVRLFEVSIPCPGGRPSTGHLSVPMKGGPFPARIHLHGYNESWAQSAYRPPKPGALPLDTLLLDLPAHGYELGREPDYYVALRAESGSNGHDYAFDPVQNANPDDSYFGAMAWRVLRGLEYLKSRPEWDGKTLIADGGSCGALQSIWAAALDHDVTECRIFIPWCCNMGGPASGRAHGDWHVPWVPALGYYDPVNMARRIPATCRANITWAGLGDYICPPSGVMAFYNVLACPKNITFIQGAQHGYIPPKPWQAGERRK